jgi:hypothetical protein
LLLFILVPRSLVADETPDALREFNERRDEITVTAMSVLAGWSVVNLGAGGIAGFTVEDPTVAAFAQMSAGWNIVNAALAVPSLIAAVHRLNTPTNLTPAESLQAQSTLEDILLFNAGIDLAYIAAGFYLTERARRPDADSAQLTGWGNALILQGGFLFVFDLVTYFFQRQNSRYLADRVRLGP